MLDFPRWKYWATWATVILGVLVALPSLLPPAATQMLPGFIRDTKVNLGLDLAGGSYILLEADVNDVATQRLETMRDSVLAEMRRSPRIQIGDISTRDGRVSFMVRDVQQVDAVRERLLPMTAGAGLTGQRDWNIEVRDSSRFVLTPTQAGLAQATEQAMVDATEVVRRRVDELGTREPTIIRQGTNRIVVQVPGLQDPQQLKALLGRTAVLEFKLVDTRADPQAIARGQAPIGSEILPYPSAGAPIAVQRSTIISGDQIADARQEYDPQTGAPIVGIRFNAEGGRRFARTTQENVGRPFAIIVDDTVISAPNINEQILGGAASISGGFTVESANELAIALRSGKLPVDLAVIEESTISPELGADSIERGIVAGIVGTLAVVILILLAYLRFGIYANIALVVNVFMIIGVMALFNATLTLPGIAGFVLTIGAAVDANVLINERIREEQRKGRTVNAAIEFGYKEASRAIFDANLTNVIAAVIMFIFGAGPVRGFAVVLTIGIVTSVFTAVTFTRLMVSDWLKKRPKELVI
ncbi:protein translocase subunit SecD [Sphingomonas baiyangensis]|uniref:Protein translocase subunit SecD n=1 Tax=Sphingomonas baiyangensis TaxID=2572576 RepID=A0A4U1LA37_9SPHN|nr:protein translocase subunit SecD [Sphingomonas baiyangensis]TKD53216.1 protein translocase subunit SecD [Sphingomonas baiyangensis]